MQLNSFQINIILMSLLINKIIINKNKSVQFKWQKTYIYSNTSIDRLKSWSILDFQQIITQVTTPGSLPIQVQFNSSQISPFLKGLLKGGEINELLQFTLEISQNDKKCKKKDQKKYNQTFQWMPKADQLCHIAEDQNQNESQQQCQDENKKIQSQQQQEQEIIQIRDEAQKNQILKIQIQILQNLKNNQKQQKLEFKSKFQAMIENNQSINHIKSYLSNYLNQDELKNIDNSLYRNRNIVQNIISLVYLKLKRIGTLTVAQRKQKVQRYLRKRKNRIWGKKISYDCRKKVADARLRIKGRFITRKQASKLLDIDNLDSFSQNQIKEMLDIKFNKKEISQSKFNQIFKDIAQ